MDKLNLNDFKKRPLKSFYLCIYAINKEIKIRTDESIESKELYVLLGIDIMGNRQILGIYLNNYQDNRFWLDKFEDIKSRGLESIMFFVTPNNKGLERCLKIMYNDAMIVSSPDNISENITKYFSEKTSRQLHVALRRLSTLKDKEMYVEELELFKEMYVDNTLLETLIDKYQQDMEIFYQYKQSLRELFYPYYTIREAKKYLNKLKTRDRLCSDINEIIEFCLPFVNSFEMGRTYNKAKWLSLLSGLYEIYPDKIGDII